jgi:hypothetical protein
MTPKLTGAPPPADAGVRHEVLSIILRKKPKWSDGLVAAFFAAVPAENALSTYGSRAAAAWLLLRHHAAEPWRPDNIRRAYLLAKHGTSSMINAIGLAELFLRHELHDEAAECCLDAVSMDGGAASGALNG